MLDVNVIMSLVFMALFLAVVFLFLLENKKRYQEHQKAIKGIKQSITIHNDQMNFRNDNLQKYNFLKYNLRESLVVQIEIEQF